MYEFIQDASQYVLSQMEALEAEQNHVDNRAGVVERKLRQLLETGKVLHGLRRSHSTCVYSLLNMKRHHNNY